MVLELCRRQRVPIRILWNNAVAESFTPEQRCHKVEEQALHIRGDHAYFLADRYAKGWITRRDDAENALKEHPSEALQTLPKAPETSVDDWQPLPAQLSDDIEGHFYTVGEQETHSARAELHRMGIVPRVALSGPSPQSVKKMTLIRPGKPKAVIHRVHEEHNVCKAFANLANARTGGSLVYSGESPGAIMHRAFEELTKPTKREEIPAEIREGLVASQNGLCADCGDELRTTARAFEIDHRVPLRFGGGNSAANLAAICGHCHAQKTPFENSACHLLVCRLLLA